MPEATDAQRAGRDSDASTAATDPAPTTPLGAFVRRTRTAVVSAPSVDEEAALDELIPDGADFAPYLRRFCSLTVLSSGIAAFGLLADSAGVVIGAMLVAPLMVPITAAAAATVRAQNARLIRSMLVLSLGVFLAVAIGYATSYVAGFEIADGADLPGEVLSRTFPGLLDLGVAITAGAAAGYITTRRTTMSALPGVGIAVALVPPLVVVGITAQVGLAHESRNAFLLFLTNLAAIVFAASVMLLISGFRPVGASLRLRLGITLATVVVVAVPLTLHTRSAVLDSQLRRDVTESVAEWDDSVRIIELTSGLVDGTAEVELIVSGPNEPRPVWQLAEGIRDSFGYPVDLDLRYERNEMFVVSAR